MNDIFEKTLLYDFYGELLTEHQKKIYEEAVFHDLSLSEIAQDAGISRQGVHDLIRRCNHLLEEYESKLHLVEKFQKNEMMASKILEIAKDESIEDSEKILRIKEKAEQMLDAF